MRSADDVLVTGATGGIGQALCRCLASEGLRPLVGYRPQRESEATALARDCGGFPLALDMADKHSIDQAIAQIAEIPVSLTSVVIAASPPPSLARFGQITEADMDLFWTVNVSGPQRLLAGLVKNFLQREKRGSAVALLSEAMGNDDVGATPNMGAYVISKYGLAGVMALLAADYPWLVVKTFAPGFTDTPMLKAFDARYLELQRARAPFADPAHVAEDIARFLVHEKEAV